MNKINIKSRNGKNKAFYRAYEKLIDDNIVTYLEKTQMIQQFSKFKPKKIKKQQYLKALEFCKQKLTKPTNEAIRKMNSVVMNSYGLISLNTE